MSTDQQGRHRIKYRINGAVFRRWFDNSDKTKLFVRVQELVQNNISVTVTMAGKRPRIVNNSAVLYAVRKAEQQ